MTDKNGRKEIFVSSHFWSEHTENSYILSLKKFVVSVYHCFKIFYLKKILWFIKYWILLKFQTLLPFSALLKSFILGIYLVTFMSTKDWAIFLQSLKQLFHKEPIYWVGRNPANINPQRFLLSSSIKNLLISELLKWKYLYQKMGINVNVRYFWKIIENEICFMQLYLIFEKNFKLFSTKIGRALC